MLTRFFLGRCAGVLAALTVSALTYAGPITGVAISGEIEYVDGELDIGTFGTIVGGVGATSGYEDGSITAGPNPRLASPFTMIGDGFTIDGSAESIDVDDEFYTEILGVFSIANATASDYDIVFKVTHANSVTATGGDAFAESLLDFVEEPSGTDLPDDTYVESDSLFGPGGTDSDNGMFSFTVSVGAGESLDIEATWVLEGGLFDTGSALGALDASILIDSVTNVSTPPNPDPVPEPGTWVLMSLGAAGFAIWRRRSARESTDK